MAYVSNKNIKICKRMTQKQIQDGGFLKEGGKEGVESRRGKKRLTYNYKVSVS